MRRSVIKGLQTPRREVWAHRRSLVEAIGADDFQECFVDEGNSNIFAVVRKLREIGFHGFILDDHVPHLVNDSPYGLTSAIHTLKGVLSRSTLVTSAVTISVPWCSA